jgi:uncharacterized protein GlcG (DUF336 family)
VSKENLGVSISIDLARRVLEASKQRARELRSPVSIAIVDASGHLVLFERMMAPYGWATGNISIAKANTSVMFNQTTDAVAQWATSIPGFAASLAAMTDGKFIMAAGGWPIRLNGVTIGGIGVSGGNAPGRDDDIARAGLSVLASAPPQVPVYTPPQAATNQIASAPVPPQVPVYTPPQAAADQAAPAPVQGYSNGSAEYPASVPTPDNSPYADMTENTTNTNYLSNEESPSLGKSPSSNANMQERSGDQS